MNVVKKMKQEKILKTLKNGELIIMPTDTIYGLVGDATNEDTINKVYEVKKRDKNKPLLILVSDLQMLKEYVAEISPLEKQVINKFWPGPLTIILKKNNKLSNSLTGGQYTLGIRMPNNENLRKLIKEFGKPIIATSANIAGEETITNIYMLEQAMKKEINMIIDGGTINSISSTIIKVENNKIIFLREGLISNQIKKEFKNNI